MRNGLSFGEMLSAIVITALVCSPSALARLSDYSTDMEEPNIMTVKSGHCCDNARLKEESNVELDVTHAVLPTFDQIKIEVMDESNKVVAQFSTHNRVVYMHLPDGKYSVKVDGLRDHQLLNIEVKDSILKSYVV